MAAQWCIECWNAFKQRTVATRVIEDDPYCAGCAVRLGFEDAPEKIEVAGEPAGIASGVAGVGEPPAAPEFAGSDPEASPGSFAKAIKKAFLPKAEKKLSAISDRLSAKGEAHMNGNDRRRKEVDWKAHDRLVAEGKSTEEIATALGCSSANVYKKRKERGTGPKPTKVKRTQPRAVAVSRSTSTTVQSGLLASDAGIGRVFIDLPETALDRFFALLPVARKVELLTQELAARS